jgi:uncharacterized protein YciI
MKFFIVDIDYRVPLERIEQSSPAHRNYLQSGIDAGLILFAGPCTPRTGGVVVARADSLETIEGFFANDPYLREQLADYRYREFLPLRHQPLLTGWAGGA